MIIQSRRIYDSFRVRLYSNDFAYGKSLNYFKERFCIVTINKFKNRYCETTIHRNIKYYDTLIKDSPKKRSSIGSNNAGYSIFGFKKPWN